MLLRVSKTAAVLLIALALMYPSVGNAQAVPNLCTAQGGALGANAITSNGSFGTGSATAGTTGSALPAGTTDYTFAPYNGGSPQDGQYSIVNRLNTNTFNYWFSNVSDHTTGAVTGQMMVVNAAFAPGVFYRQTLTVTPNTNYEFSGWFLNLPNPNSTGWTSYPSPPGVAGNPAQPGGNQAPNVSFTVNRTGLDAAPLEIFNTGNIPFTLTPTWVQYGGIFNSGASTQVQFAFRNNAPGGVGNDFALDDLRVASCAGLAVGSMSGVLYEDSAGNNVYDSGSDPLLPAGVLINLFNASGQLVTSQTTNASGAFSFVNIPVGSGYRLTVVPSTVPAGYSFSAIPTGASTTGSQSGLTVSSGTTLANQDFGFRRPTDLSVTKTDGATSVNAGATTTYTVRVTNNGPGTVTGALLADPAATGLTKTAVACSATPGQCSTPPSVSQIQTGFALPALVSGQFYEVTVTASVTATSGSVSNVATVTGPPGTTDPTVGNNAATDTDTVTPVADLSVTKTNAATAVNAGGTTTYTVRVTNNGPSAVTGAIFSDPVATGLTKTAVVCSGTPGQCATAPTITQLQSGTFALPALASGQFYEVTVTATVSATSGSVSNVASAVAPSGTTDPTAGNNAATDTDTVTPVADLSVTKTNAATAVNAGGTTTYIVRVTNNGPSSVTGATLSDPAATGLTKTAVACSGTPGQCSAAPTVPQVESGTFALPALASGQFYEVTVTATVSATSGSVSNVASAAVPSGTTDPTAGNNAATDTDTVTPVADLSVTKTDARTSVGTSGSTTYTVRVTNNGPSAVTAATLSDPAASGLTKTAVACSATPGQCTTAPTITQIEGSAFTLPALASGQFYEVTVTATATATSGTVTNLAAVTPPAGTTDPTAGNNTATDTNQVYVIDAVADSNSATPVVGATGGSLPSVLTNDTLNGVAVSPGLITLTPGTAPTPAAGSITMNPDATIAVASGTTAGFYSYSYTICEDFYPTNCDTATVTIVVSAAPINAVADAGTVANGAIGGIAVANVLANDTLAGVSATLTSVSLTQVATTNPNVTLNPATGAVAVAPGTPAGTYSVTYQICELLNPTNCDTVTATATVGAAPIDAGSDSLPAVNGASGGTSASVLGNDTLNGVAATVGVGGTVTLTPGTAPTPTSGSITTNPDGTITVAAGTTAGSYTYGYTICELLNPTNCDTATATVVVAPAPIDAVSDSLDSLNGLSGGTSSSVIANDTLNGVAATVGEGGTVTLAPGTAPTPASGSITMNPDGTITLAAGTTAGSYTYGYTICEVLNPTNCDTATATVVVSAALIDAVSDPLAPQNGYTGGTAASVLSNDTLNGTAVTAAQVLLIPGTPPALAAGSITMNADGTITVAAGTTAGTYSYSYTICDRVNPTSCDTATATVVVAPPVVLAVDDDLASAAVNGFTGGVAGNVLTNDLLSGAAVNAAQTTITVLDTGGLTGVTIADGGAISVPAGTPAGSYTIEYQLCEDLNAGNCDTALVTIQVNPPVILAVDDDFTATAVNGFTGGPVSNVLTNDRLNGVAINPALTSISVTDAGGLTGVTISDGGVLAVPAGTPAGTYTVTYQLCEDLNPGNCDTATVLIEIDPPVINAVTNDLGTVNGLTGETTASVLGNDTLNGAPVTPAQITLTPGGAPTPASGSMTMNPDGTISVAAGTTAGTYAYAYTICEILNPTNCDTATATVIVGLPVIDARPETSPTFNGILPPGLVVNVLTSDRIGGLQATVSNVTIGLISIQTDAGLAYPGVSLDTVTGNVEMAVAGPGGIVQVTYQICDVANSTNCDTQVETLTILPLVLEAIPEAFDPVNGLDGGSVTVGGLLATIIDSDIVDSIAATLTPGSANSLVISAPVASDYTDLATGLPVTYLNLDPATGIVTVAPNTPAGSYGVFYEICDPLDLSRCDGITETVVVEAAPIVAVGDTVGPVNGFTGGSTLSVLGNDTLNGLAVDPADITLTPGAALNPIPVVGGITLNSDGAVTVAPGTSAGVYEYSYTICENLNPTNCDTATITIRVAAPAVDAIADAPAAVNGYIGGLLPSVLSNDTLNGAPLNPADVLYIPGTSVGATPAAGSITLNPDGTITVAAGTTAGSYTYSYTICDRLNPTNCDSTTVTVVVSAAPIDAVGDAPLAINGRVGGSTATVIANDTLNGTAVIPAEIILTPGAAPTPAVGSITMNSDGTITVAAGTTAGVYSYPYAVCEVLNPANCDSAVASITVAAAPIDAVDDSLASINGITGGSTAAVLANDTLNGTAVVAADITLIPGTAPSPAAGSITMNGDGTITVALGTRAGTYSYPYTICERLNPANCDSAVATVIVASPVIDAIDDAPPSVNGLTGGTTATVLGNDTLNGVALVAGSVTLTPGTAPSPASGSIMMSADGTISIAPNTTAGSYTYAYTICDVINPTNCDTATVTVTVAAPVIDAVADALAAVNGLTGGTTATVLANDTLNGAAPASGSVTLTPGTAPSPVSGSITMNADGTISIAPNTTAGTYTFAYTICETINPANCDTTTASVVVGAAPIDAVDDDLSGALVNGFAGGSTATVLTNDTLNGVAVDPTGVTLTPGIAPTPAEGSITMNSDGTITVAAGTKAGVYTYDYSICEVLNPTNCDGATSTVVVSAAPIDAVDDTGTVANGLNGGTAVADVLSNDTLNGDPVSLGSVTLAQLATTNPNVTLVPATGAVFAAPGTAAGTYTVTYELCEVLNPTNCDTTTVNVTVGAAPIIAEPDTGTVANGSNGGTAVPDVLTNDTLNGAPVSLSAVTLSQVSTTNPNVTLDPATGAVSVAPATAAGTYVVTYSICELLNPTNCDLSTATVTVGAAPIDAVSDSLAAINGASGGSTATVLGNDTLNGAPVVAGDVALTPGAAPVPAAGLITMNPDGTVTVAAGTTAGSYSYPYTICQVLNPANCDTATATITVGAAAVDAAEDSGTVANGLDGGTALPDVLVNDTLNGAAVSLATVTLTQVSTTNTNVTLDPATGAVLVAGGTPTGTYVVEYQICEVLNAANCDTTSVTVTVGSAPIDAVDDGLAAINGFVGGISTSVLGNDTLNGVAVVPDEVTLTPGMAPSPVAGSITMNPDGTITVPAGTTAGIYTYAYTICEMLNPTNCDTANVTVIVDAAVIDAVDDDFSAILVNGLVGGTAGNLFGNDSLNTDPVDPGLVDVALTDDGGLSGIIVDGDGDAIVPANTPAGTYVLTYSLCEVLNPANCDTATFTIVVAAAEIDAVDDAFAAVNGLNGGTTSTVLSNDTLNGVAVDPATITLTPGTAPTPAVGSITMNSDGTITVAAGTTAGSYSYSYEICEVLNPANCDTATVTVVVGTAVIDAMDDAPVTISSTAGGTTASVLVNDLLNGAPVDPAAITLTPGAAPTPAAGAITMNADGTITVEPGTFPGTYSYSYTICEVLNPANCDTASATVTVLNPGLAELVDDTSGGNAPGTPVTIRVLGNDRDPNFIFDLTTLQILGTAAPGAPLVVPGEGVWTVDLTAGTITFTPEPGFQGNPTSIQYQLVDLSGVLLAPAFVIITYDLTPAFVCSDVIGKVFDDKNHDGYQDPGEAGIPAARLATVNGKIITTDEHGRFSVPCADIPQDIGSTFLLKLDPRSLPTGYRVTTENPRTVRLTQGTMAKMNFGVSLTNLIRIDLTDDAFDPQTGRISKDLDNGLKALVKQIARKPSFVRLSYFVDGKTTKVAKDRLKLVEDRLRDLWRDRGRGKLGLETTVITKN